MFLVMLDLSEAPGSMAQVSSPSLQWKRLNHPKESPKPKTNKNHQIQECSLWTRSSQQQQAWCKPQNTLQNVHEQNSLNSPKGKNKTQQFLLFQSSLLSSFHLQNPQENSFPFLSFPFMHVIVGEVAKTQAGFRREMLLAHLIKKFTPVNKSFLFSAPAFGGR